MSGTFPTVRICLVDGCARLPRTRGWCDAHYKRWLRHGDPTAGRTGQGEARRMFEKLVSVETDDCVIWPFSTNADGYGKVLYGGRLQHVSALALTRRVGERPPAHLATHGPCHNPTCMNYRHLSWATQTQNLLDRVRDNTATRGSRHPLAKLSESEVRQIRQLSQTGCTQQAIADSIGTTRSNVSLILRGKNWGWLP